MFDYISIVADLFRVEKDVVYPVNIVHFHKRLFIYLFFSCLCPFSWRRRPPQTPWNAYPPSPILSVFLSESAPSPTSPLSSPALNPLTAVQRLPLLPMNTSTKCLQFRRTTFILNIRRLAILLFSSDFHFHYVSSSKYTRCSASFCECTYHYTGALFCRLLTLQVDFL